MMTEKQKMFAETYLSNGMNAREAYYATFPNSKKTNKQPSYPYRLLKDPEIAAYIEQRRKEMYESLNIDAMRIITELSNVAFKNEFDENYTMTAKLKALEQLSKNLGLQSQKIETKEVIEVLLEE